RLLTSFLRLRFSPRPHPPSLHDALPLATLLLLLLGQVQPIVQSALPDEEVDNLVQQVLEVARQQGMEPAGTSEEGESQEEPAPTPPLIAEAYEAIEKGDLDPAGPPPD